MNSGFYSALQKKWQLNDGNSLFWTKSWKPPIIAQYNCSARMYQKINSSIVSKGAMNKFREMFLLAVMHTPTRPPKQNKYTRQIQQLETPSKLIAGSYCLELLPFYLFTDFYNYFSCNSNLNSKTTLFFQNFVSFLFFGKNVLT